MTNFPTKWCKGQIELVSVPWDNFSASYILIGILLLINSYVQEFYFHVKSWGWWFENGNESSYCLFDVIRRRPGYTRPEMTSGWHLWSDDLDYREHVTLHHTTPAVNSMILITHNG